MASIIDIYKASKFAKAISTKADKTPISADGGKDLSKDEKVITKARGGKLNEKPYSTSVKY
jgi:hypothetical protein